MTINLGIVMDPIEGINVFKDSTFAMLLEAQKRGYKLLYIPPNDLYLKEDMAMASAYEITVEDNNSQWFEKHNTKSINSVRT